jgi:hypothetical protein
MSTGVKEGDGTYTSANGDVFTGTYHNDNRTTGTYTAANGDVYVGDYLNEMKEDTSGVYTTTRGSRYEGGFHLDNWEGRGVFTWADGAVMTSGWCGGAPHGDGVIILGSKALLLQDGQRTSTTTVSDANQVASGIVAPSSCPARHGCTGNACRPGGSYDGHYTFTDYVGNPSGCTDSYCDSYLPGGNFHSRCTAPDGSDDLGYAMAECRATCHGLCQRLAHWDETRDNPFSSGHGHSAASRPHRKFSSGHGLSAASRPHRK